MGGAHVCAGSGKRLFLNHAADGLPEVFEALPKEGMLPNMSSNSEKEQTGKFVWMGVDGISNEICKNRIW